MISMKAVSPHLWGGFYMVIGGGRFDPSELVGAHVILRGLFYGDDLVSFHSVSVTYLSTTPGHARLG